MFSFHIIAFSFDVYERIADDHHISIESEPREALCGDYCSLNLLSLRLFFG